MVEPADPARERSMAGGRGVGELGTLSRTSLAMYGGAIRTLDAFELLRDLDGRCTGAC